MHFKLNNTLKIKAAGQFEGLKLLMKVLSFNWVGCLLFKQFMLLFYFFLFHLFVACWNLIWNQRHSPIFSLFIDHIKDFQQHVCMKGTGKYKRGYWEDILTNLRFLGERLLFSHVVALEYKYTDFSCRYINQEITCSSQAVRDVSIKSTVSGHICVTESTQPEENDIYIQTRDIKF